MFGNVDNSSAIAQEEIFGPVLSVIPADDEQHAIAVANDTIYGLNASVFTNDVERAREVAGQLRSGARRGTDRRPDYAREPSEYITLCSHILTGWQSVFMVRVNPLTSRTAGAWPAASRSA